MLVLFYGQQSSLGCFAICEFGCGAVGYLRLAGVQNFGRFFTELGSPGVRVSGEKLGWFINTSMTQVVLVEAVSGCGAGKV